MEPRDLAAAVAALHRETSSLYAEVARDFGLTSQQIQLLCMLAGRPSFGELAASLGCDKTNITGLVNRLEKRGVLAREPDTRDRRISRVVLTETGEELRERVRRQFGAAVQERFGRLGREERARYAPLTAALGG
ncbi:MarR family transcriptional regulator [Streptomyces albus]|uniref:MarR family transcriptional regulator n=1 Tax=Streptomyces albus (strain ATCC 21838 / DSM 41398 / FERM P-419 / JCM 4703 / NBRC 107858) TaxID=1081613 RepID=A0A0B5F4W1_STRA4|nr:MarR family transcriptional regulator [Streptomyces albus]AOU79691.1 MarR family transcriptional regulator [Streptomyces albus]AYN35415.1 MarR family transcriptional regulator [Streptomyces albus]